MLYKYVVRGCICWLSEETIEALEAESEALESERKLREAVQSALRRAQESNDPMDWSIYSDLYKDCHGVRPRY